MVKMKYSPKRKEKNETKNYDSIWKKQSLFIATLVNCAFCRIHDDYNGTVKMTILNKGLTIFAFGFESFGTQ